MKLSPYPILAITYTWMLFLLGCSACNVDSDATHEVNGDAVAVAVTDGWVGQWNGPEGTFLRLAGDQGKYLISIQSLDELRDFQGRAVNGQINFERNGVKESIHATNGAGTGMKWLIDKSTCLTIRIGEGYCRD